MGSDAATRNAGFARIKHRQGSKGPPAGRRDACTQLLEGDQAALNADALCRIIKVKERHLSKVTLTIAEPARAWIDSQVASGRYADSDAYLADLVERDRTETAKLVALRAALDEGLASGVSARTVEDIIREGRARHAHG